MADHKVLRGIDQALSFKEQKTSRSLPWKPSDVPLIRTPFNLVSEADPPPIVRTKFLSSSAYGQKISRLTLKRSL